MDTPEPPTPPEDVDGLIVYRTLFSAYPDALLLVDAAGLIVLANPAASGLLGYPPGELVGLSVDALVPDSIRSRHGAYRQTYAGAPRSRPMGKQMELVAKRRDGSEVMVEIGLSPLQDHGLPYVVAAIRDIGGYPRVQQALQRARYSEHLAHLGRLAADGRDPQLLLQQVPSIAAEALEVEMALVLLLERNRLELRIAGGVGLLEGESLGSLVPLGEDHPLGFVLNQGRPVVIEDFREEQRFATPAAYLDAGMVSALAVPLVDRGSVIGILKVRSRQAKRFGDDEQRFVQALANLLATCLQRAQSEEALSHAQRLESVGQLTGGIAHDFNNLLTVIQGNLQALEELAVLKGQDVALQLVGAALRASKRGTELTGKLLAFSRRQVLQPSVVDVEALLLSLSDMLRRTLDQHIRIDVEIAEGSLAVVADPGQLESALLNIAINARDAMPDGGALRFSARQVGSLPEEVRYQMDDDSARDERYVCLSIVDTGCGMTEEVKERAFEPFFTTKQAGRGTGLGLSSVYGFVKQSHGAVAIESAPGAGTAMSLYLPRPSDGQVAADEVMGTSDAVPPGLRVLLVEDDAEVRAVAQHFLDALGCEVTACASAEQAVLQLTPDTDFELLLTDIALGPGMRGTDLAALVQQRLPRVSILLMSGFSAELLDADHHAPPSWELLPKPYSRSELAQAIARALKA